MSDEPNGWPPNFERWPRETQAEYLRIVANRAELLAAIRGMLLDPNGGRRLTKNELAELVLILDVWRSVERDEDNSSNEDP